MAVGSVESLYTGLRLGPPEEKKGDCFLCLKPNNGTLKDICSIADGKPRLAALIPHLEDEMYPSGFFLKPLPYADEIRTQVLPNVPSHPAEEAEKKSRSAMNLIKTFTDPHFKVGTIRDPRSDTQWAAVEALALQRSDMEIVRDEMLPVGHGMKRVLEMDED